MTGSRYSQERLYSRSVLLELINHRNFKPGNLSSNESRDQYDKDGYLVPSRRCGFSFEVAFHL